MFAGKRARISNVVCTADLGQEVDVKRLVGLPFGIYDEAIYGGRCGYIKSPEMPGRVTVFPSGKMISVGGRSVAGAAGQLNHAKFLLVREGMASEVRLRPQVRNIVGTVDVGCGIPIDRISSRIPGASYDPETFPAMILKGFDSCSFLVFASGKIVVSGARTVREVNTSLFELLQRLEEVMGLKRI